MGVVILIRKPHLFSCCLKPPHLLQFLRCIIKSDMGINIQGYPDIGMPHQILQCLRIHPGLCHVGAISVTAYMRSDVWHGISKTKVAILSDSHDKYDNIVLDICIDLRFRHFLVVSMPQSGIRMKPDQQFSYMKTILV